jgi:hypothetical protein
MEHISRAKKKSVIYCVVESGVLCIAERSPKHVTGLSANEFKTLD